MSDDFDKEMYVSAADRYDAIKEEQYKNRTCGWCWTFNASVCRATTLVVLGIFLTCLAAFVPPALDSMVDSGVDDLEVLTPDKAEQNTDAWQAWVDTRSPKGQPLTYKVWMWNITNPYDIIQGAQPILKEIGPYAYKEHTVRYNTSFQLNEDSSPMVSALSWTFYIFDEENTGPGLSESDVFTSVNLIFQTLAGLTGIGDTLPQLYPSPDYDDVNRLFCNHTFYEFAFGYNDPVLSTHPVLGSSWFPGLVINETQDNATAAGFSQWFTGENENWNIRSYQKWEDSDMITCLDPYGKKIPAWDNTVKYDANRVYGTDADLFQRNLVKGGNLQTFVDVIYREATIVNVDSAEVEFKGINLLRYVLPENLMANSTENPTNAAYYAFGDGGVINLTRCSQGAPIFISKPHFLDVVSANNTPGKIVGLNPIRDQHDTFIDVEPITGLTMHAAKRLQINTLTTPVTTGRPPQKWFPNLIPNLFIPLMWIEEGGEISDSDADDFKSSVILVQKLDLYLYWIGFVLGYIFIGAGTAYFVYIAIYSQPKKKPGNINVL